MSTSLAFLKYFIGGIFEGLAAFKFVALALALAAILTLTVRVKEQYTRRFCTVHHIPSTETQRVFKSVHASSGGHSNSTLLHRSTTNVI